MMQKIIIRASALVAGALVFSLGALAQKGRSVDVDAMFNVERGQVAQTGTPFFWLKGGAVDASLDLWRGLGVAANVTAEHGTGVTNGVNFGKFAYMAGPGYIVRKARAELFGEALFGGAHTFDSMFPGANGVLATANAFSMQAGGGVDVELKRGFGMRLF